MTHLEGHSEKTFLRGQHDKSGGKNAIQAICSTVTYLERYTLFAITGLAAMDQDDDGRGSSQAPAPVQPITPADAKRANEMIKRLKVDEPAFLRLFEAESVETILATSTERVFALLEQKEGVVKAAAEAAKKPPEPENPDAPDAEEEAFLNLTAAYESASSVDLNFAFLDLGLKYTKNNPDPVTMQKIMDHITLRKPPTGPGGGRTAKGNE